MIDNKKTKKQIWWQPAVFLFTKVSAWIVGPLLIALFLGKFIDQKFHTEPLFFIILISSAFLLSMIKLFKEVAQQMKIIEKYNTEKKENIKNNDDK